jgi:HSP20 family protein
MTEKPNGGSTMTNLVLRPFNGATREMDRWFNDFFGFPALESEGDAEFVPRVDIKDTKDNVVLTFELPGMEKKDIKVLVKDGNLVVSGERTFKSEQQDDNRIRSEIRQGKFSRSFSLPDTVNPENIGADYKNGMLEIRLAKLEEVKPKEIEVRVS